MITFPHTLVREVLYSDADPADRTRLHRQVAEVLQDRYGDSRVLEVAHHTLNGLAESDGERAADLAVRAAAASLAMLAYEDAAGWYARAVELLRRRRPDDLGSVTCWSAAARPRWRPETCPGPGPRSPMRRSWPATTGMPSCWPPRRWVSARVAAGSRCPFRTPSMSRCSRRPSRPLGPTPSALRAWVLARLSIALSFLDAEERRRALSDEAVEVARRVGREVRPGSCAGRPLRQHRRTGLERGSAGRVHRDRPDRTVHW